MTRVLKILGSAMFNTLKRADIAVDLGTSKIAVFIRGEGLVLDEPACIAFKGQSRDAKAVIATGLEAFKMCGKTPQGTTVVTPIQNGVISDYRVAGLLLHSLMSKNRLGGVFSRRRFLVGSLYGASSMESRAFELTALAAGAKSVSLVAEPLAAAIGAGLPINEPRASMVVDVGGGATEAMVISLEKVVRGNSIRIGGDAMNHAIIHFIRKNIGLDIGSREARRLKEAVVSLSDPNSKLETRGLDTHLRRPRLGEVTKREIHAALAPPIAAICEMVKSVVDSLPPELAGDLIDRGIKLTGGGSATFELRKQLEDTTKVPVVEMPSPHRAVIQGCGQMLSSRIK